MEFHEVQTRVFRIVLRYSVRPAEAGTYLYELNRCDLVDDAPAGLRGIRDGAIGIEEFLCDLEVITANDEPIGFE